MRWLVLEGIDGVGKTSQGRALARHLREAAGVPASYSHIFDTGLGSVVRREFLGTADLGPYIEALLLVAARLRYFDELILPRLGDAERVVITDRYFWSIATMQGLACPAAKALVDHAEAMLAPIKIPDLIVVLDADPETCRARRAQVGRTDRIESQATEFHQTVRARFLELASECRQAVVLDATGPFGDVQDELRQVVLDRLFDRQLEALLSQMDRRIGRCNIICQLDADRRNSLP